MARGDDAVGEKRKRDDGATEAPVQKHFPMGSTRGYDAAGEKRKRDDGVTEAPKVGVVRVEKATTGKGHCGWCDTPIELGSPRVVKHQYHQPGKYSRNNGESTGYNPGGFQDLFLHPQCAWHVMCVGGKTRPRCSMCGGELPSGSYHLVTILGVAGQRCTKSSSVPVWQCVGCVGHFIHENASLLDGYISEKSQFDEVVPWGERPRKSPFCSVVPARDEPKGKAAKEAMRAAFRSADEQLELQAVERHRALMKVIEAAMGRDKELQRK